ncbi:hypothetical protein ASPWEDRAFT_62821 [Aspergillus wentii DTO 134E9]|uniref:Uncharacterized protein n=1 Tax=Aspergillus wentii DTO 134E9 TaxID=1073089 RepID=A0A1L9R5H9_ASPWE|nr:uncharacterized protein ASPWEDRAFT_62821 [Aspergillus wentii DTO 134E9]KAI9925332.1 hypothetical protein MW887_006260 [Aspergillus wentii]OJJ30171.1 hypothetical protein ASPWEDRAFT_62821 [Aspergillus wentii DTO 134E9]
MAGRKADIDRIAVSPSAPNKVPQLLRQIALDGQDFVKDGSNRQELLDAVQSLFYALETPREVITRHTFATSTTYAAIETCIKLGVFVHLSQDDKPKSVEELAKATNCDALLLTRLLQHLVANGAVNQVGPTLYCRTALTIALTEDKYSDTYPMMTRSLTAGIRALPAHLHDNNYINPTSYTDSAHERGYNTSLTFWEALKRDPLIAKQFSNHMAMYGVGRPSWMDVGFYPVQRLLDGVKHDDTLLVDVGGSIGHDILEFQRKWPNAPGRLVLQDLDAVLSKIDSIHPRIEVMPHDFFTPQPVKGARAYYLHSVLHDWPDAQCHQILANIIPAMKRGYSKILINEHVIPDVGAHWEATSLDLIMMSIGSTERTEKDWRRLLEGAGLRIVRIWSVQRGVESLIECEVGERSRL